MTPRYLFNSDGEYVAFIVDENIFNPDAEWIGFLRSGLAYHANGTYMGQLLRDDRIAINERSPKPFSVFPPFKPFKPFRPLSPMRRLRMAPLPLGWKDVFESGFRGQITSQDFANFAPLEGSNLIAGDEVFLGIVTKNRFDPKSLSNRFAQFGNKYSATSIFNPYSQYGSKYGAYSPFNKYSTAPPKFVKAGREIGRLTVNPYISNKVDPEKFFLWFENL